MAVNISFNFQSIFSQAYVPLLHFINKNEMQKKKKKKKKKALKCTEGIHKLWFFNFYLQTRILMSMKFQWKFVGWCWSSFTVISLTFYWNLTEVLWIFSLTDILLKYHWHYIDFQSNWWISQKFRCFTEILVKIWWNFSIIFTGGSENRYVLKKRALKSSNWNLEKSSDQKLLINNYHGFNIVSDIKLKYWTNLWE